MIRLIVAASVLTFALPVLAGGSATGLGNKVDLEDVKITGESMKMNGLEMLARERNTLDGRVHMRTDFNDRSLEDLPKDYDATVVVLQASDDAP